ncbi:MAG: type IV secretion system protein [Sphingomicrobium sp.]
MIDGLCAPSDAARFTARLLADTDCQAAGLVERGYAALAAPGGTVSIALTGLMVMAVALFGYRLLLGRGILLADAMALTIKLGVVMLIASSWDSWSVLVYQGLAKAPTQVAGDLLTGIGSGDPIASLDRMLDALAQAAIGYRQRAGIASPLVGGPAAAAAVLNLTATVLTLAIVGILVAARVVMALLLAIAPAMAGLILFNGTRRMAQGWLSAMAAAAIAPLFVVVLAAVEFAIMEPMMTRLLAEQAAGTFENGSVMPLGLVTVVFLIATIFALRAGMQIALGVRLPQFLSGRQPAAAFIGEVPQPAERMAPTIMASPSQRVGRALESLSRREDPTFTPASNPFNSARASSATRDARQSSVAESKDRRMDSILPPSARRLPPPPRRSRASSRRDL